MTALWYGLCPPSRPDPIIQRVKLTNMLFLPSWLRINEPALKAEHLRITPSLPFQKHVVQTQDNFEKNIKTNLSLPGPSRALKVLNLIGDFTLAAWPKYDRVALEQWQSAPVSLATSLVAARSAIIRIVSTHLSSQYPPIPYQTIPRHHWITPVPHY